MKTFKMKKIYIQKQKSKKIMKKMNKMKMNLVILMKYKTKKIKTFKIK